jgi:cyclic beta-1,2-glucan synthetase
VLSGAAPPERAAQALDALEEHLVSERDGLIRLLTPPFDRTAHDPGYIRGYLPGVRENGGQYTHGALWAVRALAEAGRVERAAPLLEMLSPVSHTRTPEEVAVYQAEPYVIAADVYGEPPHTGRGGWTWYTGSSGWMLRVALESVLGLQMDRGHTLRLRPRIPSDWPGYALSYRVPGAHTRYEIDVRREGDTEISGRLEDGTELAIEGDVVLIPLSDDSGVHRVSVRIPAAGGDRSAAGRSAAGGPSASSS